MSKHTSGPWVARKDPHGSGWCIGLADDVTPIDYIAVCDEKNAPLIAAAPELLEALHDMVSDRECLSEATIKFAQNAIAKATSEREG